jgi:hypothetical protein
LVELAVAAQQYTKKVTILEEYKKFSKVFSEEELKRFPPRRSCDHTIEFKPGAPDAIKCKIYPMRWVEDEALDVFINEQLEKGYIRPSKSQYASSFFFIKKKDSKLRPVQDYRKVNAWTVRNQYPLPLIGDLIRDLSGAIVFTKFDICQGYNNIRIKEGDKHKAMFKTRRGLFEPTVMYFGLCKLPATFQAFMNDIYRPTITKHNLLGTAICVYMDDIAIATKISLSPSQSHAAHVAAVSDILKVALEHDLYFKLEKCVFHAPSIDYLGVILEKGVTCMDPIKISGIKDWPTEDSKGHTLFSRLLQLLPPLHQRICNCRSPTQRTNTKRCSMDMGRQTATSIHNPETPSYERANTGATSTQRPIRPRSGRLWFRRRSDTTTEERRWEMTPHGILLGNPQRSRTQLQHLQFGTPSYRQSSSQLATPTRWIATRHMSVL